MDTSDPALAEVLLAALVSVIVDVPVELPTYAIHLEALNTLIVLLSIQMYHPKPASKYAFFRYIMTGQWCV